MLLSGTWMHNLLFHLLILSFKLWCGTSSLCIFLLELESIYSDLVFEQIEVKVKENWRQDEGLLKHYGYGGQIRVL